MKKFDLHLHTKPASCCGQQTASEVVEKYHKLGFGGIVLTNHYSDAYLDRYCVTHEEHMQVLVDTFDQFKKECDKVGIIAIFGVEVAVFAPYSKKMRETFSAEVLAENFAEFLLYGLTKELLFNSPRLCDMTQAELFDWCNANDVIMIQSHPFRTCQGISLKDVTKLHGLEINTNAYHVDHDDMKEERILELCKEHNLITFASNDNHEMWQPAYSCTFIPDDVTDGATLVKYMKEKRILDYDIHFVDEVSKNYPRPINN